MCFAIIYHLFLPLLKGDQLFTPTYQLRYKMLSLGFLFFQQTKHTKTQTQSLVYDYY